jgi:hypothetical protein
VLRSLMFASVLASFVTLNCSAQSSQSGSDSGAAKPAPQAPQPPAGTAAPKGESTAKDQATNKKKPKKVWTNEEIPSVGGNISVVGDQKSSNNSYGTPASPSASGAQDAASYRNRLAPLRQQVDDIDREIQQMRSSKGSVRENIESQVQIREARREKIQKQINEIEEDARRHGIASGDLR